MHLHLQVGAEVLLDLSAFDPTSAPALLLVNISTSYQKECFNPFFWARFKLSKSLKFQFLNEGPESETEWSGGVLLSATFV